MDRLELKGDEQLNENEKFELNKLMDAYNEKIKRATRSEYTLKLAIKKYLKGREDKKDAKARYSLAAELKGESQFFEASAEEWDFNKAVHKLFGKLLTEIEHKYHSSEQRGKSNKPEKE